MLCRNCGQTTSFLCCSTPRHTFPSLITRLTSFQMHIESLQRSMPHRTMTYFVHQCRFIWALRRPVSPWVSCQYVYASSPLRSANGKSGYISLRVSGPSYFALLCLITIGVVRVSLLTESIVLLESVINSRWFSGTSIILLLTGLEGFKAKLRKVPLESYFPEYTGGVDINKAAKYILWRFMQVNRARSNVYPHLVNVFDTKNLRILFTIMKEIVLQKALKDSGIF
jgi:hypothetical protein